MICRHVYIHRGTETDIQIETKTSIQTQADRKDMGRQMHARRQTDQTDIVNVRQVEAFTERCTYSNREVQTGRKTDQQRQKSRQEGGRQTDVDMNVITFTNYVRAGKIML